MTDTLYAAVAVLIPVVISLLAGVFVLKSRSSPDKLTLDASVEAYHMAVAVVPGMPAKKKLKAARSDDWLLMIILLPAIVVYSVVVIVLARSVPFGALAMLFIGTSFLTMLLASSLFKALMPGRVFTIEGGTYNVLTGLAWLGLGVYICVLDRLAQQGTCVHTVSTILNNPITPLLLAVVGSLGVIFTVFFGSTLYALRALERGDYERALRRINLVAGLNRGFTLQMSAIVMNYAGRFDEAERLILEQLHTGNPANSLSLYADSLTVYGIIRLRQGDYAQAEQILQTAMEIYPETLDALVYLAEVYLLQGVQPDLALELTERAYHQKLRKTAHLDRHMWGDILGNKAWALAMTGHQQDCDVTLDEAFERTNRKFKPALAGLHWRAGQAMILQGDYQKAAQQFLKAVELDPRGAYGSLSANELSNRASLTNFARPADA